MCKILSKKALATFLVIVVIVAIPLAFSSCSKDGDSKEGETLTEIAGNYSDEMKFDDEADLSPEDGADSVERSGDHKDSQYFSHIDPYNMKSNGTLTILPKFKTIQQSSEWSCGVTAAEMVINYFGKLNKNTEATLAKMRPQKDKPEATNLDQEIAIFKKVGGFDLTTTRDYKNPAEEIHLKTLEDFIKGGTPVLICWNDWGGHWQVIIGYDNMGTEVENDDVLIVADPYDTTDHNQDGYGVIPAERFIYNFTMYDFFKGGDKNNDFLFIAAKPST
ncbi:MAG: C39 family peptidase [Clostridiales Family XIII bacterium]|jgi:hypothetical protein|nr:C39 family peptidase [Clostridiales Family XIII bacterium]